jgi:hypothetical protein
VILSAAGAEAASGIGAVICGREDASSAGRGALDDRGGDDGINELPGAGAPCDAPFPAATGDPPLFCSSIRIASSGVGMSAT